MGMFTPLPVPPQDVVAIRKRCSNPKCRQSNVTIAKEMPSSGIIKFLVNSSKNILLRRFIACVVYIVRENFELFQKAKSTELERQISDEAH